ncbi:hypothetical protein ABIB90_008228 [Bradyrhizobium sp. JR4.1]|uniref:hypothetical protein n=1 Tax=Bradyrhizobium sp. JR4.1 TaxID=3156372 RepID=UPI003393DE3D
MLETYFSAAKMLGHLRSGPSGPYLDGFAAALEQQGYGPATAVRYLRAAAHSGHVMAEQGAGRTDVDLAGDEHLRTCRCPRAKGGRRNHHTIYGRVVPQSSQASMWPPSASVRHATIALITRRSTRPR